MTPAHSLDPVDPVFGFGNQTMAPPVSPVSLLSPTKHRGRGSRCAMACSCCDAVEEEVKKVEENLAEVVQDAAQVARPEL